MKHYYYNQIKLYKTIRPNYLQDIHINTSSKDILCFKTCKGTLILMCARYIMYLHVCMSYIYVVLCNTYLSDTKFTCI